MSLKSNKLPDRFQKDVFLSDSGKVCLPLVALAGIAVATGTADTLISPFECAECGIKQSEAIARQISITARSELFIRAIQQKLRCDVDNIFAYFIAASKSDSFMRKVDMSIKNNNFVVIALYNDNCIIAANREDVAIKTVSDSLQQSPYFSQYLQNVLLHSRGYHTYNPNTSPIVTFADMLEHETVELSNTAIYGYLAKTHDCIAAMHIPMKAIPNADMYRYFNSQIVYLLSEEYNCDFGSLKCCWVCDSEEAVENYYIKPFCNMSSEICEIKFNNAMLPVCDLGAQGCLIISTGIEVIPPNVDTTCADKEITFEEEPNDNCVIHGLPVFENGFALAVDEDSFTLQNHRHPVEADKSVTYRNLYLLRDVPNVPVWQKCTIKDRLYRIELGSFGIKSIKVTDIPAQHI